MTLLTVALTAGASFAQSSGQLDELHDTLSDSYVTLSYMYSAEVTGVPMKGNGNLTIQGNMWLNEMGNIKIICDGASIWTIDDDSKEVIIDSAENGIADFISNPALLFTRMNDYFDIRTVRLSPDGKYRTFILTTREDSNMEYFNLEVRTADNSIQKASFALDDGTSVRITVDEMTVDTKKPVTYFRPSQAFDSSWIVTDLR